MQVEMDTRGCVVEGGFSGWMGCRAVTGERQARRFAENRRQAEPDGSRIIICSLNALPVQFISVCFAFVSHDLAPFNVFQRGGRGAPPPPCRGGDGGKKLATDKGDETRGEGEGFLSSSFRSLSLSLCFNRFLPPFPPTLPRLSLFLSLRRTANPVLYRRVSADRLLIPDARVMFFY